MDFRLSARSRRFRAAEQNVFNHTQFSGIGTTQYYHFNSGINATFGQPTSARPPRILALSGRIQF